MIKCLTLVALLTLVVGCGEEEVARINAAESREKLKLEHARLAYQKDKLDKAFTLCMKLVELHKASDKPFNCNLGN